MGQPATSRLPLSRISTYSFDTRGAEILGKKGMAEQILDAKGLNCPLPILRAKKAIQGLRPGDTLEVLATDPGAVKDFQAFCRTTGHELLESSADGKVYRFVLRRAG